MQSGPVTEFCAPTSDGIVTMSHQQAMVGHSAGSSKPASSNTAVNLPSLRRAVNRARLASTPASARARSDRTLEHVLPPRSPSVAVGKRGDGRSEGMSAQVPAFGPPARGQFSGRREHDTGRSKGVPARVLELGPPAADYKERHHFSGRRDFYHRPSVGSSCSAFSKADEMAVLSEAPLPFSLPPLGLLS